MTQAEIRHCNRDSGSVRVEQFHDDGSPEIAIFIGTEAKLRAESYYSGLNYDAKTSKSTSSTHV